MVLPLIIAGVAMIGSALISWYQSNEAQTATEEERQKIADLINATNQPDFDMSTIPPDIYKVVAKYVPEAAQVVQQQAPEVIKNTQDMQSGRQAQMQALSRMQQIASQGKDPMAEMDRLAGARQAAQEANTQNQNIQAGMQRRGIGDSALSLGLQQQQAGDAGYRTAMAGEQAARDAVQRRIQANQESANVGGQMFNQDAGIQSQNVNAINRYNQEIADRAQKVQMANVNTANEAGLYNNQNAQNIANLRANLQINERDKQNQLKQMMYGNQMNKISTQAGQGQQKIGDIWQGAQNNQALATGVGQTAASIANSYNKQPKKKTDEEESY